MTFYGPPFEPRHYRFDRRLPSSYQFEPERSWVDRIVFWGCLIAAGIALGMGLL